MGKIVFIFSSIVCAISTMFADFSIFNHSFGQGELVCLVWILVFIVSCICLLLERR